MLIATPAVSRSQPADADRATARSLAREGYEAEKRGQFAVAADRFSRAEALVHAPTLLLGLARAQVGLGKLVEAQETYERIVREPLSPSSPAPFSKAVEDARRELADLTPRLAWVTLSVVGPASPEVVVDDVAVPAAALGVRRATDPGAHSVKATAPGYAPMERTFVASEGAEQSVNLVMDALPAAPVSSRAPSARARVEPEPGMPVTTKVAIVSFGIGAAGLVAGAATGIWVLARHGTLREQCVPGGCPQSDASALSTYRSVADLSTAAFIVGAIGAAAGVTLLFATPKEPSVAAYVGPFAAGVTATF